MQIREEKENTKIYKKLIAAIHQYCVGRDVNYMFLHGGCYWLASILHEYIPDSNIVFNRKFQHCACQFNRGVYDIRGRIMNEGFEIATAKDTEYMEKRFIPCFDTEALSNHVYLAMNGQ